MRWRDLLELNQTCPLPADFFQNPRRVHFIGIGGIGMSALAFLLKARGHQISGSDAADSPLLQQLREAEISVTVGQKAENLVLLSGGAEAVFWSSAIAPENVEMLASQKSGLPAWHRAQLLAHFVNTAQTSIAVSGTHGKSTTSAMIAHILTECGHDPTAILGAIYPPFKSNFRLGDENLIVVEADESDGSFTLLKPTVAVVLNVEPEHLENYDDSEEELWRAFEMFVNQADSYVLNADDFRLELRLGTEKCGLFCVNPDVESWCGMCACNITSEGGHTLFKIFDPTDSSTYGRGVGPYSLPVPGLHNISNALAALYAAGSIYESLPISEQNAGYRRNAEALKNFAGILRRFEKKGEAAGIVIYDDYGHHPTEVKATLEAAKEFLGRPIFVIFQPHRYSRTQTLHREFGPAFGAADKIIITQLYSAFEEPIEGVSGRLVFDAARENWPEKPIFYAENLEEAQKLALEHLESGDALLTMGAGDITKLGPQILEALTRRDTP